MKSLALVLTYFGKWPVWFDSFLVSCAGNPTVNWIIFTDCPVPINHPRNVKFLEISLEALNAKVDEVVEADVPLTPRKLCDLKPAYGHIFDEYLEQFDFWGFCDLDVVWGNIRAFLTDEILDGFDIVSSRNDAISGHCTILRNSAQNKRLYRGVAGYRELFEKPGFMWFDEQVFTNYLKTATSNGELSTRIWWDKILLNQERGVDSHQDYYLDRWLYDNGNLFDLGRNGDEKTPVMYLHFINWKRTMKFCEVAYENPRKRFYVSYNGMHYAPHSTLSRFCNDAKNLFNGYYAQRSRRAFGRSVAKRLNLYRRRAANLLPGIGGT